MCIYAYSFICINLHTHSLRKREAQLLLAIFPGPCEYIYKFTITHVCIFSFIQVSLYIHIHVWVYARIHMYIHIIPASFIYILPQLNIPIIFEVSCRNTTDLYACTQVVLYVYRYRHYINRYRYRGTRLYNMQTLFILSEQCCVIYI